jgi:hypothetical protein
LASLNAINSWQRGETALAGAEVFVIKDTSDGNKAKAMSGETDPWNFAPISVV